MWINQFEDLFEQAQNVLKEFQIYHEYKYIKISSEHLYNFKSKDLSYSIY